MSSLISLQVTGAWLESHEVLDRKFLSIGDLALENGEILPSVLMVRLADQRPSSATPKMLAAILRFGTELEAGALVVVENARCRLRRLPLK